MSEKIAAITNEEAIEKLIAMDISDGDKLLYWLTMSQPQSLKENLSRTAMMADIGIAQPSQADVFIYGCLRIAGYISDEKD